MVPNFHAVKKKKEKKRKEKENKKETKTINTKWLGCYVNREDPERGGGNKRELKRKGEERMP